MEEEKPVELSYSELTKQAYGLSSPPETILRAFGSQLAAARAREEAPTIVADEARLGALTLDETDALLRYYGFEVPRHQLFPA